METGIATWLPLGFVEALAATPHGGVLVPLAIGLLATSIVTFSVPGALTPTAFLSGLLMGFGGILVVVLGAALGSHILFLASRRWLSGFMRRRFGAKLDSVGDHLARRGPLYVAGARLTGVPHIVVTAGCAATPISARSFLTASLLGMLPAISLAAVAGSAI
ncbi:TVP38/TMEM64 family protein [Aurantiacibacter aquimixticola]|uniref:TVP38/TMEM64 family membrane protein n=1 Tax=Aurantiacibacter aquimixticola TaxID=1958945 RepID=A0A419RVG9_9SPHN|nr:VTT domain-containing protein [Aurantiacibacter aquimixticola]RJY09782.1 TVP38/TMEM64 family protein [Aurantiacibacter aquimixticola]